MLHPLSTYEENYGADVGEAEYYCANCGTLMNEDDDYCEECGYGENYEICPICEQPHEKDFKESWRECFDEAYCDGMFLRYVKHNFTPEEREDMDEGLTDERYSLNRVKPSMKEYLWDCDLETIKDYINFAIDCEEALKKISEAWKKAFAAEDEIQKKYYACEAYLSEKRLKEKFA